MDVTITIPEDLTDDLTNVAGDLKLTPTQCVNLALQHFLSTDTVDNAIEGVARISDGQTLVDFPELKEELGLDLLFHPFAMEELESVEEDDQIEILEHIINRIAEEDEDEGLTLVLQDNPEGQVILLGFDFGDVVYQQKGENTIIYHIALIELDDEDEDEEDEEVHEEEEAFEEGKN